MVEDPLNLDCFFPPKQEKILNYVKGYDENTKQRNGGMTRYNRVHLAVGQIYYRFCDSMRYARNPEGAASGPWWAEFETFNEVRSYAARTGSVQDYASQVGSSPLSYAAQLHFAIPFEWGDCGWVVKAQLIRRLDAYKGWGDVANLSSDPMRNNTKDGGAKFIPLQKQEIYQLFIPDLPAHFTTAFKVIQAGPAKQFA
jgi:hypothetical protein